MRACLLAVLVSACAPAPAPVAPVSAPAADWSWLPNATHIRVIRGRGGLAGGTMDTFEFRRSNDGFGGVATHVDLPNGKKPEAVATVLTHVDLAPFLRALSSARPPAPPAPKTVVLEASDDYPFWDVLVEDDGARAVRFESPSTGRRPPPWFVWSGDHRTPVDLPKIESIFEALDPSLREAR